jgi:hypothetical protein
LGPGSSASSTGSTVQRLDVTGLWSYRRRRRGQLAGSVQRETHSSRPAGTFASGAAAATGAG